MSVTENQKLAAKIYGLEANICNLRHELDGMAGYDYDEEFVAQIEEIMLMQQIQLCAAKNGVDLSDEKTKRLMVDHKDILDKAECLEDALFEMHVLPAGNFGITYQALQEFREKVADPTMELVFAATEVPDGTMYVDCMEINFLDGRNCGVDAVFAVYGVECRGHQFRTFQQFVLDENLDDFINRILEGCIFVSDGRLFIQDECAEMKLETTLRNFNKCKKLFHVMEDAPEITPVFAPVAYEKMLHEMHCKSPID